MKIGVDNEINVSEVGIPGEFVSIQMLFKVMELAEISYVMWLWKRTRE